MNFELSEVQRAWREKAQEFGRELPGDAAAGDVITGAARVGLIDPQADFVSVAVAVEALASESAAAGMTLALHTVALAAFARLREGSGATSGDPRSGSLVRGEMVGALSLSTEQVPSVDADEGAQTLTGGASWVGPVTGDGLAIVGARRSAEIVACAVPLDAPGVAVESLTTSGLVGFVWAQLTLAHAPFVLLGEPMRIMALARTLIAAVALGIGERALRESLTVVERYRGAGGEQTVQGLLADTATELEAARLVAWQAAAREDGPSLANASMAKLAAATAAQAAVTRATQVVGVASFRRGHVIERLTQDVRAIELFAGRTEALREAVASETLPRL